jgi:hypothetical protein
MGMRERGRQDAPVRSRAGIARVGRLVSSLSGPSLIPVAPRRRSTITWAVLATWRQGMAGARQTPCGSPRKRKALVVRPPRWSRTARPRRGSWTGGCLVAAPSTVPVLPRHSRRGVHAPFATPLRASAAAGRSSRRPLARYGGRPPLARQTPAPHPRSAIRTPHERAPG